MDTRIKGSTQGAQTRRAVIANGLLLALGAGGAGAASPSARAFVESIYARYRGSSDKFPGILLDRDAEIRRYFTPSLAHLMIADRAKADKAQEVPALDGDPFVDAQDWDIKDLSIAMSDEVADRASATVRFRNFGDAKEVRLKLARLRQGWRIDDIIFPGGEGTLRGLYAPSR